MTEFSHPSLVCGPRSEGGPLRISGWNLASEN